jgi:hypothetical protein
MPYVIALLAHTLDCGISGRDLSAVALDPRNPEYRMKTPGTLIKSKVPSASKERIDELWEKGRHCGGAKSTGTPDPNCPVRAWLSAV